MERCTKNLGAAYLVFGTTGSSEEFRYEVYRSWQLWSNAVKSELKICIPLIDFDMEIDKADQHMSVRVYNWYPGRKFRIVAKFGR